MEPKLNELTDIPAGSPREATNSALGGLIEDLAKREVPVGRFHRARILGAAQVKLVASYIADWFHSRYEGIGASEQQQNEARVHAALELFGSMAYMRGTVMKFGQLLATYPRIAPEELADILYPLHFEAPPMHFSLLREFVRNELGAEPEDVFDDFETKAFAAASLGQVHRARLKGSGERVAVKIQYPSIGRAIRDDFQNLKTLISPMRLSSDWDNLLLQFEEVRNMLERETDYEQEAKNIEAGREAYSPEDGIVVPKVYSEFSTKRVLTMEFIDGVHLREFLEQNPSQEVRDEFGRKMALSCFRMHHRHSMVYADVQPGNYYFLPDGRLGIVDFGCCYYFSSDEQEYLYDVEVALSTSREAVRNMIPRATATKPGHKMNPEHMRLVEEFFDWLCEPINHNGVFDFGDPDYFQRGIKLLGEMVRGRHFRAMPMSIWLDRNYLGLRALLYRLGARVNLGALMKKESTVSLPPPG